MSAYSGIASAAVAFVLVVLTMGQPVWEWRMTGPTEVEVWSYRLFGVDHILTNLTTGSETTTTYTYYDLPGQPRMSALFIEIGRWFLYAALAGIGALGLSIATALKKLRGSFAGLAYLGACAMALYASLFFVFAVSGAALPLPSGQPIPDFRGTAFIPTTNSTLTWGPLVGWFLLLGEALVFGWTSSEIWHVRVRRPRTTAEPSAPRPASTNETPPPREPLVQITSDERPEPTIDEVFVIAPSGLLVKHMSRSLLSDKDRDVVGGMISVVSNFVREAFTEKDGQVQEIALGGHRFIMYNEDNLVTAVMVGKGETEDVLHRLKHLTAVLKDRYGERIMGWDGEPLEGIEDELNVLWEPFFVPPPPAD
jgi:hypothetical protein